MAKFIKKLVQENDL